MEKHKISDTDSFWGQFEERNSGEDSGLAVRTAAPVGQSSLPVESPSVPERSYEEKPQQTRTVSRHQPQREQQHRQEKRERRTVRAYASEGGAVTVSRQTALALAAAALVCLSSFIGIFWKMSADKAAIVNYIQTELTDIRTANDAAITEMGGTLDKMEADFAEIISLLEKTGAAIGSSSAESRNAINERITKLDKQLQALQKSLAVLQEDANGRKK